MRCASLKPKRMVLYITVLIVANLLLLVSRHYFGLVALRTSDDIGPQPCYIERTLYESPKTLDSAAGKGSSDYESLPQRSQTDQSIPAQLANLEKSLRSTNGDATVLKTALRTRITQKRFGSAMVRDYVSALEKITLRHETLLKKITRVPEGSRYLGEIEEDISDDSTDGIFKKHFLPVLHTDDDPSKELQGNVSNSNKTASNCKSINQNVAFLKVHKAGSTTVQNILQRYALANRLNVVLPNKNKSSTHYHYLGEQSGSPLGDIIPIKEGQHYNMIMNHAVYSRQAWSSVLPEKTFYLAIVREPESRFLSAAYYYGLVKRLQRQTTASSTSGSVITEYLKAPRNYSLAHYFHNAMAYDFGIHANSYSQPQAIFQHAKRLGGEFDLIMLMEYFDHSLILLKRQLCWQLKDILYLQNNKGAKTGSQNVTLTPDDKNALREWQSADVILYRVFSTIFWNKLQKEGNDFYLEVENFKNIQRYVLAFCANKRRQNALVIKKSKWNSVFSVTKDDCKLMKAKELELHDFLVEAALKRIGGKM